MSQRALAAAAGLPQSTVARIETGRMIPRIDTVERLLNAAGRALVSEPRLGVGIDRTMIVELLRLSPAERLRAGELQARELAALDAVAATRRVRA